MSVNNKLVIALQPRAILANVLGDFYILLLPNLPKGSRKKFAKYVKYFPCCTCLPCCFLKNKDFTVKLRTHYIYQD